MKGEIIILSGSLKIKANRLLSEAIEKHGYTVRILDPTKLQLYLSDRNGWDLVYDNYRGKPTRIHTGNIKAIIPRLGSNLTYNSFIINQFTSNLGVYTPQTADAILTASNKMKTLQKCSSMGLKVPKTIFANDNVDIDFVVNRLGLPIICKTVTGSLGVGVFIMESKLSAKGILQTLFKQKQALILQEFVGNGTDIRAVVVGGKVIAAEKRKTNKRNEFRANLSLGGSGSAVTLDEKTQEFCIKAAKATGLNIAGVDIMVTEKKEPILIEVNANFGLKIQDITGIDVAGAMVDYVISQIELHSLKNKDIQPIPDNEYINEIYKNAKGKKVKYTDRNNNKNEVLINNVSDVYKIMFDTFKIE